MPAYGEAEYWDHRYQAEPVYFDWYLTYQGLEPVLKQHVSPDSSILQLGVGMSTLQADMVQQGGYQQILSVDISAVAIKHLQKEHAQIPQLKYRIADARSLPQYKDCSFDAIIDKGTLDSLMCGEHAGDSSMQMLEECHRLLKADGVMVNITYGEPAARVPLLQRLHFNVSFYVLTKATELAAGAAVFGVPVGTRGGVTLHGPFEAASQSSLEAFPHAPTTYYVYVCTKPGSTAIAAARTAGMAASIPGSGLQ